MQTNKKTMVLLILSALIPVFTGCPAPQKPVEVIPKPDSTKQHQNSSMSKRFQQSAPKGQTAVESAIELSKKYANLSEQMTVLQQKNRDLIAENNRLATLEPELKQTKKELDEANELLIKMRIELNNWKTDILGFRDEMRNADKAQLEALLKVLKILGGEVKLAPPALRSPAFQGEASSEAEGTEASQEQE